MWVCGKPSPPQLRRALKSERLLHVIESPISALRAFLFLLPCFQEDRGMKSFAAIRIFIWALPGVSMLAVSCGNSAPQQDRPADGTTGAVCEIADDCFPLVEEGELKGEAQCLDRVEDGYCTHSCTADSDCCAVEGECEEDLNQVCGPFESTGQMLCFLSCEREDIERAQQNWEDPPEGESDFCHRSAGYDFICRSTGGGASNRKVCVPGCGVGAACTGDDECSGELVCEDTIDGGYCTQTGCTADDDCPPGSVCAVEDGVNLCLRDCTEEAECASCRGQEAALRCANDATLVEQTGTSVCRP